MDIAQFRTLVHVAELGSLSKAAERMNVAQPALSRQIRLLEEELGVRLFERHGRGMLITDKGRQVLHHATRIMAEFQHIRSVVADENAPIAGHVSVGMPQTAADVLSEPLVEAFRRAHPDATLRLVSAYSGHLLEWLYKGEIDASILYDPETARTLRLSPLIEETLFLIGPASAALAMTESIQFSALKGERLVLPSHGHGLRMIVEKCARRCGISLDVRVETDSYSTLKGLVRGGYGMTILPLPPIHSELQACLLTAAPLTDPVPNRRLVMAYPTDRPTPRLAQFAGTAISGIVRDLSRRGLWS